jgi:hypothetical protein
VDVSGLWYMGRRCERDIGLRERLLLVLRRVIRGKFQDMHMRLTSTGSFGYGASASSRRTISDSSRFCW